MIRYDFAKEFTKNPGLRFKKLGDFSGKNLEKKYWKNFLRRMKKLLSM